MRRQNTIVIELCKRQRARDFQTKRCGLAL
jgi:hypothetical protein